MAYTTADRDAVKAAMLQLVTLGRSQVVRFSDGSSVEYAPVNQPQMQAVLNAIEQDIAAAAAASPLPSRMVRAIRLTGNSGY